MICQSDLVIFIFCLVIISNLPSKSSAKACANQALELRKIDLKLSNEWLGNYPIHCIS